MRALPLLLVAAAATLMVDSQGGMRELERLGVDLDSQLHRERSGDQVVLVSVTDEDLRTEFGGQVPLRPAALESLIKALVDSHPRVIAVTIDTSIPLYRSLRRTYGPVPVVWSRDGTFAHRRERFYAPALPGDASMLTGLADLPLDHDGVVRRYQRLLPADRGPLPSLAWATIAAARHADPMRAADGDGQFYIRFTDPKSQFQIQAGQVLALARRGSAIVAFRDACLVLGADYRLQPEHATPAGWMLGSEVVAQILGTELSGRPARAIDGWQLGVLQVLQGVALLFVFQLLRFRTAMVVGWVLVPLLAAGLSFATYRSLSRWGEFAPILIVVLASRALEELRAYRSRLLARAVEEVTPAPQPRRASRRRTFDDSF